MQLICLFTYCYHFWHEATGNTIKENETKNETNVSINTNIFPLLYFDTLIEADLGIFANITETLERLTIQ